MGFGKFLGCVFGGVVAVIAAPIILPAAAIAGAAALSAATAVGAGTVVAGATAISGGALLGGLAKSVNNDYEDELNSINDKTSKLIYDTEKHYKDFYDKTNTSITNTYKLKKNIFDGTFTEFIETFGKIKSVDISSLGYYDKNFVTEIETLYLSYNNNSTNKEYGSYSSFSTNGAVMGVLLGGTYFIGSIFKGVNLSYKIDEAKANYSKVKADVEEVKGKELPLRKIVRETAELRKVLRSVDIRFKLAVNELKNNIAKYGTNYKAYNKIAKEQVYVTMQLANACKILLDAPVVNKNGKLDGKIDEFIQKSHIILGKLDQFQSGIES